MQELGLNDASLKDILYEYSKTVGPDIIINWLNSGASKLRQVAGNSAAYLEIAREANNKGWADGAGFSNNNLESILNLKVDIEEFPGGFTPDGPEPDRLCGFQTGSPDPCNKGQSCNQGVIGWHCDSEWQRNIDEWGCAATVESGSWCKDNDACYEHAVCYWPREHCHKALH